MINPKITDRDDFELMMYHKRSVVKISLFIGMPLVSAMAIKNVIKGDHFMAFTNCTMLLILILLGFVIMRRIEEKSEYKIYSVLFRLFNAVVGVSLLYDIGFQSNFSRIEWCYIYPVLAFFAVGVKEGMIWVSIFYGILAFLILNFDLQGITFFQIQELRSRFLVSFFAVCMLSFFMEYGFRRVQQRLLLHQRILKESENRYRQAYEQLNIEMQERKRAEEALLNAAQQWRTTFDGISDIVCLLDSEGRILRCNKAMTHLLGKPFSEILNRPYWEIIHGTTAPIKESPFERMRENRRRETSILPIGDRWFSIAVDPLLDEAGSLLGAVHIMSDITEHKRTVEALRTEKDRLQTLSENAPFGMVIIDEAGNFKYINPKFSELFGYDLNDVPDGKTWFRKAYPDPTYRHHVISAWINDNDLGSPEPGEKISRTFTVTCKDGTEKIINFLPVKLETNHP
jgi:PAS domain S-box-containing protein